MIEPGPNKPNKPKSDQGNMHGLVKTVSDAICQSNHFALDAGGKLYCYRDGVYQPNGETVIKRLTKRFTVARRAYSACPATWRP